MFHFRKPSDAKTAAFLQSQRPLPFRYRADLIGASSGRACDLPVTYGINHFRARLGDGEAIFDRAIAAIRQWKMFSPEMIDVYPAQPALEAGTCVALRIRAFGLWAFGACRIVYTFDGTADDDGVAVKRFGFAYGTLPAHVEQGEERFSVQWRRDDDSVWYDLFAFSRPGKVITWLGMPVTRYYQRHFARLSAKSMQQFVADDHRRSVQMQGARA
jgi:uncharacterized protein (UPF0548 family)